MYCKKCSGRMYADIMLSEGNKIDISCLMCGRRVFVSKHDNALGRWLYERSR